MFLVASNLAPPPPPFLHGVELGVECCFLSSLCPSGDTVIPRRGKRQTLRILHRFYFNSLLKRMSAVVSCQTPGAMGSSHMVTVKGAAEVLRPMVRPALGVVVWGNATTVICICVVFVLRDTALCRRQFVSIGVQQYAPVCQELLCCARNL